MLLFVFFMFMTTKYVSSVVTAREYDVNNLTATVGLHFHVTHRPADVTRSAPRRPVGVRETGAISGNGNHVGTAHARTATLDAQVVGAGVVDQRALVTLSEQLQLYDVII